ncbi:MAG: integrase family protein [Paracoccaceae bacterium]|nr:integrase family protein [Paracoccaceae bacterium]
MCIYTVAREVETMALSTDVAIKKWTPAKDGEAHSTGGRSGLYVRGWKSGSKAFYLRVETWLKIGDYPDTTLAQARELALIAKRLRGEGFSTQALSSAFLSAKNGTELEAIVRRRPHAAAATVQSPGGPTYNDLWEQWFGGVEMTLQSGPSRRRPRAIHEQHISPTLGKRPIAQITRAEIFSLLEPLFKTIPTTAGHALGHISKVFERAAVQELIPYNPTPPRRTFPKRQTATRHHGTLEPERLPDLWQWLVGRDAGLTTKTAILFAMVTAHRVGVIVEMKWEDYDPATGIWTVPERKEKDAPGRMKSGRAYSLALPEGLQRRIEALQGSEANDYVFASPVTRGHISPNALLKVLKQFDPTITSHGFRNAIKIFCRKAAPPIPDYLADAFCDHSLVGLDRNYRRQDTSKERAEIAERLYLHVTGGVE